MFSIVEERLVKELSYRFEPTREACILKSLVRHGSMLAENAVQNHGNCLHVILQFLLCFVVARRLYQMVDIIDEFQGCLSCMSHIEGLSPKASTHNSTKLLQNQPSISILFSYLSASCSPSIKRQTAFPSVLNIMLTCLRKSTVLRKIWGNKTDIIFPVFYKKMNIWGDKTNSTSLALKNIMPTSLCKNPVPRKIAQAMHVNKKWTAFSPCCYTIEPLMWRKEGQHFPPVVTNSWQQFSEWTTPTSHPISSDEHSENWIATKRQTDIISPAVTDILQVISHRGPYPSKISITVDVTVKLTLKRRIHFNNAHLNQVDGMWVWFSQRIAANFFVATGGNAAPLFVTSIVRLFL